MNLQKRQIWFIFYSVHNRDILAELISQNEATEPLNKDVQTYYQKPRS